MVAEALVPPDAARVAIRIATHVATRGATVYTNAPKRRGEAVLADLCTLLSPHTAVRNGAAAQQCTQTPQSGAERPDPPICVHYCDPKATHNLSPRRNSVHKCPETAPKGHFSQSVYTPASPRLSTTAQQPNSVHKRPKTASRGHFGQSVYTPASSPWR